MSTVEDTPAASAPPAAADPAQYTDEIRPLYEDITKLGKFLGGHMPSHIPTISDLPGWVGAIVAYIEHGPDIVQAARDLDATTQAAHDTISAILTQHEPLPVLGQTADSAATLKVVQAQQKELDELRAMLVAFTNKANQTTVDALKASAPLEPAPAPFTAPSPLDPPATFTAPPVPTTPSVFTPGPAGAPSAAAPTTPTNPDQEGAA